MIEEIRTALKALDNQPYQLRGFIWMQGWNDMGSEETVAEYPANLGLLANDIRTEFKIPMLPFIVGELGNGGPAKEDSRMHKFRQAQRAGTSQIPNAHFVETTRFARPKELSPNPTHGHHWFGNAESYFLIGDALGKKMVKVLEEQ